MNDYQTTPEQKLQPSSDPTEQLELASPPAQSEEPDIGPEVLKALSGVVGADKLTERIEHGKKQG
ncbi:MAG: hypothetical protein LIO42_05290, partial [Oscillospiraceae bacterium]|nr:hypothetical protein [Oscillospiraceae bacterium]